MSLTIIIDKPSKTFEEKPVDVKAIVKESRKLTLTRAGEDIFSEKDSTDIATAMAATLCHEINNPLMTITAVTEVLLANYKYLSPDIIEKIKGIARAAERIKKATHKLISLDSLQYCETAASKMILTDDSEKKPDYKFSKSVLETTE